MRLLIPEEPVKVIRFIIIFYIIGFSGFVLPFSHYLFVVLTKWALLLNIFLILWFHQARYDARTLAAFSIIFIGGVLIEIIGVNTGVIFGEYTYGSGLGIKIWETPLLIGFNWLLLAYCTASIIQRYSSSAMLRILLGASLMLAYDLVLEITAPMLDMWTWKNGIVPAENYLAWFIIAFIFQSILVSFRIKLRNPIALTLFLAQFLFIAALAGYQLIQK